MVGSAHSSANTCTNHSRYRSSFQSRNCSSNKCSCGTASCSCCGNNDCSKDDCSNANSQFRPVRQRPISFRIKPIDWRITAIGILIIAEQFPIHTKVFDFVRIDEPMQFGVVIPAAQPVHPRLVVVDVAAVAERVRIAQRVRQLTRAAQLDAPCAVLVFYHNRAVRVKELWHEKRPAGEGGAMELDGAIRKLYGSNTNRHLSGGAYTTHQ